MLETINLDDGLTTAGQSLAPFGSLFTGSGILRPNSFTVSALDSPGMFVEVSGSPDDDIAIIKTADGATYFIRNTEDLQVPIVANSSGVTKTDAIVLFVNLTGGDDENAGSPGAAQVIAVRRDGVSTGLPNDGEIDAATLNNPWIFLKEVEVEHGAGEIEDEDLDGDPDRAFVDGEYLKPESVTNQALGPLSVTPDKLAHLPKVLALAGATFNVSGNIDITTVGFRPSALYFIGRFPSSGSVASSASGMASADGTQSWEASSASTGNFYRNASTSACVAWIGSSSSTPLMEASFVSMLDNGFRLNATTTSGSVGFTVLCIP